MDNMIKDESKRKVFSTTIGEEIQDQFRKRCKRAGMDMNEVLEILMHMYFTGQFSIKMVKSYKLTMKDENAGEL